MIDSRKCISEVVPSDAEVVIKIIPKPGGRRLRIVCEYESELVESVLVAARRIDEIAAPRS